MSLNHYFEREKNPQIDYQLMEREMPSKRVKLMDMQSFPHVGVHTNGNPSRLIRKQPPLVDMRSELPVSIATNGAGKKNERKLIIEDEAEQEL